MNTFITEILETVITNQIVKCLPCAEEVDSIIFRDKRQNNINHSASMFLLLSMIFE